MGKKKKTGGMKEEPTSRDSWMRLYELGEQIRELEPWEWMEEDDIFAVQIPEFDKPAVVSVMGSQGEYYAVSVYLGIEAADAMFALAQDDRKPDPDDLMSIPQLQLSFGLPEYLQREARAIAKKIGIRIPAGSECPKFDSYRPGYIPWILSEKEARLMIAALEQVIELGARPDDALPLLGWLDDSDKLFTRTRIGTGDHAVWEEAFLEFPVEEKRPPMMVIPQDVLDAARAIPKTKNCILELDVAALGVALEVEGDRPHAPLGAMLVDAEIGVVGYDILYMKTSLDQVRAEAPSGILGMLIKAHMRPDTLVVKRPWLYERMKQPCDILDIELILSDELPVLDEVWQMMLDDIARN